MAFDGLARRYNKLPHELADLLPEQMAFNYEVAVKAKAMEK